jgi:hypothetical protein
MNPFCGLEADSGAWFTLIDTPLRLVSLSVLTRG